MLIIFPAWWDVAWSTWALVIVGIFGTIAALRTLAVISMQTQALVNSERAWIIVDLRWQRTTQLKLVEQTRMVNNIVTTETSAFVECVYKNNGRTPAWIIEKRIGVSIGDSIPTEPLLDQTPVRDAGIEPLAPDKESVWSVQPGCEGHADFGKITIIYGVVKYRDIFNEMRETTFGYMVGPSRELKRELERIPGVVAYNRYT